jgi:hypothetical protein
MRRLLAPLAILVLAAPAPADAQSAKTNAPPGNSAIDEYLESVPSANGNTPTAGVIRAQPRPLAGGAGRALRAAGRDGRQLEQLVAATAPRKALDAAQHSGAQAPPAGDTPKGRSPLSSVADAVLTGSGGGTGMGAAFPVLLIVLTAGALVLGLRRRRLKS